MVALDDAVLEPQGEEVVKAVGFRESANGIHTGADILKYMQMGAAGVQMATRLVTTEGVRRVPRVREDLRRGEARRHRDRQDPSRHAGEGHPQQVH